MNVETKLSVGDKIFPIGCSINEVEDTCDVCNGEGQITVSKKKFECPECYGKGYNTRVEPKEWRILDWATGKVNEVRVESTKKETKIYYFPKTQRGILGNYFYEENVFKTEKEALEVCIMKNKDTEVIA